MKANTTPVGSNATKHFHDSEHPIILSLEQDETWAWCYEDERFVPFAKEFENGKTERTE
jgi:hypothetical protein